MDNNLSNIRLKFKCKADYNAMADVSGGRFCTHCQKTVHDFTNTKADVFRQIMAENNYNVCGRFAPEQMADAKFAVKPVWKRWLSAAMILIGFNMVQEKAFAQGRVRWQDKKKQQAEINREISLARNKVKTDSALKLDTNGYFGGVSEIWPGYPGGIKAFQQFIVDNVQNFPAAKGKRIFIIFVVEPDSTLSDIHIMRGINAEADKEVLRVVKLSRKWHPGIQNGKPVSMAFTVPVMFTK